MTGPGGRTWFRQARLERKGPHQIGEEGTRTEIVGKLRFQGHGAPCGGIQPCPTRFPFPHFLQGSLDNMTCILVCFPGAPRPCEEAIRKELAVDAALGRRVAGEQAPEA